MNEVTKYRFKITVVGDSQVGKTSLMKKFTSGSFRREYGNTVGFQTSIYNNTIEGYEIRLLFIDINCGDEFRLLRPSFYRNTNAAIIVYSLEDTELGKESFNNIPKWHNEVVKHCGDVPIFLFANKADLVAEDGLDDASMKRLVEENNFQGYYYTSVEAEENVMKAFNDICEELYKKYKKARSK